MPDALNVIILAAGMGKRMHSRVPKVLHVLAGKPLLSHVIDAARLLTPVPSRICVVYGHGGKAVPDAHKSADLIFVRQEPQLGTGHAVQQALPQIDASAPTLVLYGDVPLVRTETLSVLLDAAGKGLGVLTVVLDDPTGYGRILRGAKGNITGIVEEKDASARQKKIREVNTGIMVLPAKRLAGWLGRLKNDNAQAEYYLTDVVRLALKDRVRVSAIAAPEVWETLGVNSKAQLAELERTYQRHTANRLLNAGVTLADPGRIDVRGKLSAGHDVRIDVNCVFEGLVSLSDDVEIGANCVLRNVTVGPGCVLMPFSHLEDAVIGANCRIGPFARIRPGTRLGEDVHVGNFVEVKASELGDHAKANHLAYVGDSVVGRNVNIGAGTITCNYDGANKHRTVIEDDVHIGSDVQLVAPVTVGRGATVGAGTTVWKDVPPGGLALNAKTQTHRGGWQRPTKKRA
jgi:bifunctional UDP-N-acetylglucosamine pyrophosphorylase/glucosamine-1-phosphate N-acetyltransferase